VAPSHFAEHLEVLQTYGHPIRLQQLVQAQRERNIPDRAVVITFDDGYADNLHNAKPLLERYDIPATLFLTTGYIGCEREFWWDELERLLLQPGTLPETLHLRINGSLYRWEVGEATSYSEDDYQRYRDWRAWEGEPGSRLALYHALWQLLLPLPHSVRQKALDEMTVWTGAEPVARSTYRPLSSDEVGALNQGSLIEVGAHTVTHSFLSAHSATLQWDDIQQSKTHLEDIVGYPVTSFAYPFGDYTAQTIALTRKAGFACACSTIANIVWRQSDCFQLPRCEVQNWNGEEFARQLRRWFHD
jgi:peptidoglycan/xylan/chitin deacetylase (PgdA/CDA1 family)